VFILKINLVYGGVACLIKRQASNRKVAKLWFDSQCGSASLCSWYLSSLFVGSYHGQRHANRTASVLEWYDRHRVYNIWFKRRTWLL